MNKKYSLLLLLLGISINSQATNLIDVYNLAVRSDPASIASQVRTLISEQQQQQAAAALYPQASVSGFLSENYLNGPNLTSMNYTGTSLRLNISQVLLDVASYRENERWKILSKKSQQEYVQAQSDLIVKVIERYFEVLVAQDYVDLVNQNEKTIQSNLKRLQALYQKQLVAITGVYEAQARLDLAQSEQIEADVKLSVAYERLYEVINNRVKDLSTLKKDIDFLAPQDTIEQWLALGIQNNPSLLAIKQEMLAAKKEVSNRKAAYYPVIGLSFTQSNQNVGYDNAPRPKTNTSTLYLNFNQPIYQGGRISARKRESVQKLAIIEQSEIEMTRKIEQQIREYYLSVKSDVLKIKATKRQIESEKKRSESMQASFKYGTVTVNDVLNADSAFYKAQVEHQKAKYNYINNQFKLKNAAGVLTEQDIQAINHWLQ